MVMTPMTCAETEGGGGMGGKGTREVGVGGSVAPLLHLHPLDLSDTAVV